MQLFWFCKNHYIWIFCNKSVWLQLFLIILLAINSGCAISFSLYLKLFVKSTLLLLNTWSTALTQICYNCKCYFSYYSFLLLRYFDSITWDLDMFTTNLFKFNLALSIHQFVLSILILSFLSIDHGSHLLIQFLWSAHNSEQTL